MLETIDLISGQLRDAVCDPTAWTTALDSINVFLDGSGAALLSVDERLKHAPCSADLTEMMDDYFGNGWYARDRREGCRPLLVQKGIAIDYEFLDRRQIELFHLEFLARHGRKWFAGLGANLDGDVWCLAMQRSSEKGPFEGSDLPRLRAVQACLQDAAVHAHLVSRQWLDGAFTAFDCDDAAAMLLDRAGRILHINQAARSLVMERGTDGPTHIRLSGALAKELERQLKAILARGPGASGRFGRVPIQIGDKAFTLDATCLRSNASLVFSNASVIVQFHPREREPADILKCSYGLTKTEIRIATTLAAGFDVKAMSEMFSVTADTIRSHLKAAYAKTGTGSQAKLASLIAQMSKDRNRYSS